MTRRMNQILLGQSARLALGVVNLESALGVGHVRGGAGEANVLGGAQGGPQAFRVERHGIPDLLGDIGGGETGRALRRPIGGAVPAHMLEGIHQVSRQALHGRGRRGGGRGGDCGRLYRRPTFVFGLGGRLPAREARGRRPGAREDRWACLRSRAAGFSRSLAPSRARNSPASRFSAMAAEGGAQPILAA